MSDSPRFDNEFLNDYLEMVEDTESPRLFHVWSAIAGISAALGRRCFLPFGPGVVHPNQFIILVGNPGTRKSTAANMAKRLLAQSTGIRFAPPDTAGQRQGLVTFMRGPKGDEDLQAEFSGAVELAAKDTSLLTLGDIASLDNSVPEEGDERFERYQVLAADKHHIMIVASEFSRIVGQNNSQMLDFLVTMWDGEDYEYQTKESNTKLRNPLINILASTTPTSIAGSIPPAAVGQGFLSRLIFVHGARKYKSVARPKPFNDALVAKVKDTFNRVYLECNGAFVETPDALAYSETLYDKPLVITDSRFGYYAERRYDHLLKLTMALCASRGSMTITRSDYEEADRILTATEHGMPDALGEFGLNPLASLKQSMIEVLRQSQGPVDLETFRHMFHRDGRAQDIIDAINELHRFPQVSLIQDARGRQSLMYNKDSHAIKDELLKALAQV